MARRALRKVCDRLESWTSDNRAVLSVADSRRIPPRLEARGVRIARKTKASLAGMEAWTVIAVDSHGPHHFAVEVREGIYTTACGLVIVDGFSGRHGNPGEDLPSCHDCQTLNGEEVRARIAAWEKKEAAAG